MGWHLRSNRAGRRRRLAAPAVVCAALVAFVAGAAAAESNRGQCRRLTRQIEHFQGVAEMAADRGDELWLEGTLAHIDRLSARRIRLCPEYEQPNQAEIMAKWLAEMTKKAAKAFLKYLTFGAY